MLAEFRACYGWGACLGLDRNDSVQKSAPGLSGPRGR